MTDWEPYSPPSGGPPALQCVTTWRGPSAGSYPLEVFWAGTKGSLWRSTTDPHSEFVQMATNDTVVTRMAVDDRGTIYGIDSSGKPVQYGNEEWARLDLGDNSGQYKAIDVAVALDDTAWFVMAEGQYYVYGPAMDTIQRDYLLALKAIAPVKAPIASDLNSVGSGWAVLQSGGQLAFNPGDDNGWVFETGDGVRMNGLAAVSTSVSYAWLLKTDGSVWATQSGFDKYQVGDLTATSICGGQGDYCFAVDTDGKPWRTTDSNPMG
jgi:hypothetical protein